VVDDGCNLRCGVPRSRVVDRDKTVDKREGSSGYHRLESGVRSLRWRMLLNTETWFSVGTVFWANMAGYLGNCGWRSRSCWVCAPSITGAASRALYS
jgi:hypothetical protein